MTRAKTEPEAPRKRRTPLEAQRDRLSERIRKLEVDRDAAIREALREIKENAEAELKARLDRAREKVTARFAPRIEVQSRMLAALGTDGVSNG